MPLEIERKFLVDVQKWNPTVEGTRLIQAYLSIDPNPTVRVRIAGEKAYLTIKGRTKTISRPEFEYEIPVNEAQDMITLAISNPVEKIRYKILHKGFLWEVDFFSGKNEGLVIAELELESEDQSFLRPDWLLAEVSGDRRYYNSYLSEHPFQEWTDQDGLIFEMPNNKLK